MSVSETARPQVDRYILSVYVSLFPGFLGEFNFLVTQQTSQSYSGRPVVTAGQQQKRQGRNAAGGGWLLILSEEVETRALPFHRGWGAAVWEKECSTGSLQRRGRKGTGTGRGMGKVFGFGASRARPLACCIPKDQHDGVSFQLPCLLTPSATLLYNTQTHTRLPFLSRKQA